MLRVPNTRVNRGAAAAGAGDERKQRSADDGEGRAAEHNDQRDTHDDKQIVARVGVTPAGGMGPTAQVYAIDYTLVAAVAEQ